MREVDSRCSEHYSIFCVLRGEARREALNKASSGRTVEWLGALFGTLCRKRIRRCNQGTISEGELTVEKLTHEGVIRWP